MKLHVVIAGTKHRNFTSSAKTFITALETNILHAFTLKKQIVKIVQVELSLKAFLKSKPRITLISSLYFDNPVYAF